MKKMTLVQEESVESDEDDIDPDLEDELEYLSHVACVNFPNCDMLGCGKDSSKYTTGFYF